MNDEIKNFRFIRINDDLFVKKAFVDFNFLLKFINIHAFRAIFFESFFSKLDDSRANQKKSKKIDIATNQISRTRSFWLSFIEAKTTTAWKKVEFLREKSIFKSKDFDCLYCAKQRLECNCILNIACKACNKKKWMRFDFSFILSSLLSAQTDQESSRLWKIENEDLRLWICSFQIDSWRVKTKVRTLSRCQKNLEFWTWNAWNSWNCHICLFEHCRIIVNDCRVIVLSRIKITIVFSQFLRINDNFTLCVCCVFLILKFVQ